MGKKVDKGKLRGIPNKKPSSGQRLKAIALAADWNKQAREEQDKKRSYDGSPLQQTHRESPKKVIGTRKP